MEIPSLSKRLQLEHVNLHYLDYGGHGPLGMLLLHGGGANAHWFDFIGPALTQQGRTVAVDLRGHGDSTPAEPPVYTAEVYLQDLRSLLRVEQFTTSVLLGHSMGGLVALQYAGTWPHEVQGLIVCDTRPIYSTDIADRLRQTGQRQGREYDSQEDYMAHFRIRPDGLRAPQTVHYHIARYAGRQLPHGKWGHKIDRRVYAQRDTVDTLPYWQRVTCPVLFLRAEYGSRVTPALMQQIKDVCPQAEFAEVADAGHHLVLDQPAQTVALVQEFLRRHGLSS
jgi:pimeloyl-ACP methyl ester carboxylesterase